MSLEPALRHWRPLRIEIQNQTYAFRFSSVCQTEFDSNASRVINRLALAQGRLEFDLLSGFRGRLIESVSEAADHAVDLNVAVAQEDHIQHHVAFQFHVTPLGCVLRLGLVQDGNSGIRGAIVAGLFLRRIRYDGCVAETSSSYISALAAAGRRIGGAISKSSTGHCSANSLVASGAIAITWPARKRGQSFPVHNQVRVGIAFACQAIRGAESSGLYFFNWSLDGRRRRIAGAHRSDFDFVLRTLGLV